MFVKEPSRQEKILKYALVALGLTLVLVLLLAIGEINRTPTPPIAQPMKISDSQEGDEAKMPPTEELTGTVVAVDVENSYIRVLNDKDGKIYSIAVPSSVRTTEEDVAADISEITSGDRISLLVENLVDTERTDFSAVSLDDLTNEKTFEEKVDEVAKYPTGI